MPTPIATLAATIASDLSPSDQIDLSDLVRVHASSAALYSVAAAISKADPSAVAAVINWEEWDGSPSMLPGEYAGTGEITYLETTLSVEEMLKVIGELNTDIDLLTLGVIMQSVTADMDPEAERNGVAITLGENPTAVPYATSSR